MPEPIYRRFTRWLIGWRLVVLLVGTVLLTWMEVTEHHPPDILLVVLVHMAMMLVLLALVQLAMNLFSRGSRA